MVSTAHRLAYLQPGGGADKARTSVWGVRDAANPITLTRGAAFQGLAGGLEGAGAAAQDEGGGPSPWLCDRVAVGRCCCRGRPDSLNPLEGTRFAIVSRSHLTRDFFS